jgi:hypothetical protein
VTPAHERRAFVTAAVAMWLLFVAQAVLSPVLLDDWFQLRHWRDHAFGPVALWDYARHDYLHYNPRLGEVLLAIIDGSRAVHLILTPLVQLAVTPIVFAIAFARWPRPTLADLQMLVLVQTLIWLAIPIPGIIYFYRPITTNYLWAFTITLTLFVPYRLALAGQAPPARRYLVPVMLVLGWLAGMCNEHTGPTAMVALAVFVYAAWRRRRLRAWMLAGQLGLYIGYPMLFFAPGQRVRYGGLAVRETPIALLEERGITGCLSIVWDFSCDAKLAIVVMIAAGICYLHRRGVRGALPAGREAVAAGALALAALAIVVTLFMSPSATDRLFYASGVLLVAAFAICADRWFCDPTVRRVVVGACLIVFGYHVVRFVDTSISAKLDGDRRSALLAAAKPGTVAVVPSFTDAERSRWSLGDDLAYFPWLRDYVGGELFDLARVDLDRRDRAPTPRLIALPPRADVPTYRELQDPRRRMQFGEGTIRAFGLFDDPAHRPLYVISGAAFVDGRPYDEARGHFIRVEHLPPRTEATYVISCGTATRVERVDDVLIPVDERYCRGPFTAIACEPDRCWVAGWY